MKKTSTPTWIARVKSRVKDRLMADIEAYCKAFMEEYELNVRLADEAAEQQGGDSHHAHFTARHYSRAAAAARYIYEEVAEDNEGGESEEGSAFFDLALAKRPSSGMWAYLEGNASHYRWLAFGWAAEAAYLKASPKTLRVSASCPACLAGELGEGHFACGASDKLRDATWVCVDGPHLDGDWWAEVQHVGPAGHILAGLDALLAAFQGREPAHPLIMW